MTPVTSGEGRIDPEQVIKARDETQVAAADLSAALLDQIDIGLQDRLSSLNQRRLLAAAAFAVAILLAFAPLVLAVTARRRESRAAPPPVVPAEHTWREHAGASH